AEDMHPHLFDLYYAGLVETAINRTAGNGSLNAAYGKNLYEAVSHLQSLGQSFDDLVFMRDAEVVTSTTLDPTKNNVLAERKELAKKTVEKAEKKRKEVFDEYDQKEIDKAKINATLSNTIDSLRTELVSICGLPRGCDDAKKENCTPRTEAGFCGFDLPFDSTAHADITRDIDASVLADPDNKAEMDKYYSSKAYNVPMDQMTMLTESDIWDMTDSERNTLLGIQSEELKVPEELLIDEHGDPITESTKITEITNAYIESVVGPRITAYLANQEAVKEYLSTDLYSLTNTGEAANAVLAYRAALKDVDIAQADYNALYNKIAIARSTCDSYEANIEEWNDKRLELLEKIQTNVEKINEHYDNITQAERDKIAADINLAKAEYNKQFNYVKEWKSISASYKNHQKDRIKTIGALTDASMSLEYAASTIDRFATATAEGLDSEHFKKGIPLMVGAGINLVVEGAKLLCDSTINHMDIDMQLAECDYNYKVELKELQNDLVLQKLELDLQTEMSRFQKMDDQESCEQELAKMRGGELNSCLKEKTCASDCKEVVTCDCSASTEAITDIYSEVSCPVDKGCKLVSEWYMMGLDQWILSEQNAIDTLDEVNDTMRELFDVQDAYNRDLQDLDFRRSEYMQMAQDLITKRSQILKAQLNSYVALKNYYSIVQRAMMIKSQYDAAVERRAEIDNLYMTPATIFSFASDLETVESKIELAKERIYDYLSAVEYESVRPFVDLRRATYLARSTNDLDAIIDQIDTVVSKCGAGEPNYTEVEISAREMMGITQDFAGMTAGKRFQNVIAKGNIPINSLTRYTVDSSVRDLVKSGVDRLRSGTFAVTIKQSMNLATTCNTKIDSISVQVVGDNIIREGAGENVHPTITVFYDGQSQLASCQPNIESLAQTIGPKTAYGKYTSFVVPSTKTSVVAGINTYGDPSNTFKGKPFATSYTVLIDTQISENPKIDWDKVEDIKLRVKYSFNDVMQDSACVNL
ncbi:MAG: hypothetical protein IJU23_13535, partial [Proteobacteria bacterium]|nr:hypothetical protein [Pseudomonadota bacterium]